MKIATSKNVLDNHQWSQAWLHYLDRSHPFDPYKIKDIVSIIPLPDMAEVLIFTDRKIYHHDKNSLETLIELGSTQEFYSSKKSPSFPWVSLTYTLFAIDKSDNPIWVNPLMIHHLYHIDHFLCLEMLGGSNVFLPIREDQLLSLAEQALDLFLSLRLIDSLQAVDTPFIHSLLEYSYLKLSSLDEAAYF